MQYANSKLKLKLTNESAIAALETAVLFVIVALMVVGAVALNHFISKSPVLTQTLELALNDSGIAPYKFDNNANLQLDVAGLDGFINQVVAQADGNIQNWAASGEALQGQSLSVSEYYIEASYTVYNVNQQSGQILNPGAGNQSNLATIGNSGLVGLATNPPQLASGYQNFVSQIIPGSQVSIFAAPLGQFDAASGTAVNYFPNIVLVGMRAFMRVNNGGVTWLFNRLGVSNVVMDMKITALRGTVK